MPLTNCLTSSKLAGPRLLEPSMTNTRSMTPSPHSGSVGDKDTELIRVSRLRSGPSLRGDGRVYGEKFSRAAADPSEPSSPEEKAPQLRGRLVLYS
ncbi:hypothetical protein EYF80_056653 [Liparis tanakae]|uniref:Uncharacterized protein n=1 Tax=Liparis tanakae TaxID=230148 RepID=A0A4Z2EX76_9TELE|nr:hypothetical protein EYF80_056653 [Liparis tanakae]